MKGAFLVTNYNKQERLAVCIRSLLNQVVSDENSKKIERMDIVVLDDGSNDASVKILKWFNEKYPDIFTFIVRNYNGGISDARNALLRCARSNNYDFVVMMDSDDCAGETCINNILDVWDEMWGVAYGSYIKTNHIYIPIGDEHGSYEPPAEDKIKDKVKEGVVPHGGLCVRNTFLHVQYPDTGLNSHNDYIWNLLDNGAIFKKMTVRWNEEPRIIVNPGFHWIINEDCYSIKNIGG